MADETAPPEADPKDVRIGELSRESAGYRTQRNEALRMAHAYGTMLRAHGIDTAAVTPAALEALPIKEGRVDGTFPYSPPKVEVPKADPPAKSVEAPAALTLDEVRQWDPKQINERWDEVSALMAKG